MKRKNPFVTFLLWVLLAAFLAGAFVSGWKLYRYFADYSRDRDLYRDLRDAYVKTAAESEEAESEEEAEEETEEYLEDGVVRRRRVVRKVIKRNVQAPISVDWEALKEINEDIIGWVYFTGLPQISYPVLQAEDNAYYVNRTYDLSSDDSRAGSIFMDYRMASDFSSPYSIIYGHNVRDSSMLSDLSLLMDQELYDREPYFWILTPEGDYQYRIFSVFQCHRSADVFQNSFDLWEEDFFAWQNDLQARNVMEDDMELEENGHVVVFSTCVPNSFDRTIVCGTAIGGDKIPDPHPESEQTEEER